MAKKASEGSLKVNQCSVCDEVTLTVGQQRHGGVRYCRECIKHTLAWVQLSVVQRDSLMQRFDETAKRPAAAKALALAGNISEDHRKAYAIGESRKRLYESERAS